MKHFGHAVVSRPMAAIDEVFREVAAGAVNFGVVPVENSTEGAVSHTLDSFLEHDMVICGEVELRIHHHLLVGENTKTDSITRIYSHAQSLAQCRKWLDAHYPNVERVMDGHELTRRIRQLEQAREMPRCRILGVTANALAEERARCLASGMDDCLFKPIGLRTLKMHLHRCPSTQAQPPRPAASTSGNCAT